MKKNVFLLLALCVLIGGCVTANNKKTGSPDSYPATTDSSAASLDYSQSANGTTEQAFSSESNREAARPVITVETMTKKDVQTALQKAELYKGSIDGKYGPKTREALREFQKANGLVVDGLAGKKTKQALLKYLE